MAKRPASQPGNTSPQQPENQGPTPDKPSPADKSKAGKPVPKKPAPKRAPAKKTPAKKPAPAKKSATARPKPPSKPKQSTGETVIPESMRKAIAAAGEKMATGQEKAKEVIASEGLSGLFRSRPKPKAQAGDPPKSEASAAPSPKPAPPEPAKTPDAGTGKAPAKKAKPTKKGKPPKKAAPARKAAAPKTPVKAVKPKPAPKPAEPPVSRAKTTLPPLSAGQPQSLESDVPKAVPAAKAKIPVTKTAPAAKPAPQPQPKPAAEAKPLESEGRAKAMKPAKTSAIKKADPAAEATSKAAKPKQAETAKRKDDKAKPETGKKSKLKAADKTGKAGQKVSEKPAKNKPATKGGKSRKAAESVKPAKAKRAKVAEAPVPARVRVVESRSPARRPGTAHPLPEAASKSDLVNLAVAEARQPKLAVEAKSAPPMAAAKSSKRAKPEPPGKPAKHDKPPKQRKKSFFLPQTTRIALLVRDPWHVHLYWDLGREDYESHGFGALRNAPLLVIRMLDMAARRGPKPMMQRVVLPRAGSMTCEVNPATERWVAQIGVIGRDGEFAVLRESNEALMPGATSRGDNENGHPLESTELHRETDLRAAAVREAYRPEDDPTPMPFNPLWHPVGDPPEPEAPGGHDQPAVVSQPPKQAGVPAGGLDRVWTDEPAAGPQTLVDSRISDSAYTADWAIPEAVTGADWDSGTLEAVQRMTNSSDYALLLRMDRERGLLPGGPFGALSAPASIQPPAPAMPAGSVHLAQEAVSSEARPAPARDRGFWMRVHAELLLYGATEPDARVTVMGEPVDLREDGSFSLRFALPDGDQVLEVRATSADGIDARSITPVVHKHTEIEQPRLPESREAVVRK